MSMASVIDGRSRAATVRSTSITSGVSSTATECWSRYLPAERILHHRRLRDSEPGRGAGPPVNPSLIKLVENLDRLKLDFTSFVTVHPPVPDRPLTRADLLGAVGRGTELESARGSGLGARGLGLGPRDSRVRRLDSSHRVRTGVRLGQITGVHRVRLQADLVSVHNGRVSLRASSPAAAAELAAHAEFIRTYPEYQHTGAVDRLRASELRSP